MLAWTRYRGERSYKQIILKLVLFCSDNPHHYHRHQFWKTFHNIYSKNSFCLFDTWIQIFLSWNHLLNYDSPIKKSKSNGSFKKNNHSSHTPPPLRISSRNNRNFFLYTQTEHTFHLFYLALLPQLHSTTLLILLLQHYNYAIHNRFV